MVRITIYDSDLEDINNEGSKKLAMLSNKFEGYRIFIANTDEME